MLVLLPKPSNRARVQISLIWNQMVLYTASKFKIKTGVFKAKMALVLNITLIKVPIVGQALGQGLHLHCLIKSL